MQLDLSKLLPFLEQLVKELREKEEFRRLKEQQETFAREQLRAARERAELVKKYTQDNCDHIAGSSPLSEQYDACGRTSIVWHTLDTGVEVGICTNCGREFRPEDERDSKGLSYLDWRKKPSFNKPSAAGQRRRFVGDKATYQQDKFCKQLEKDREERSRVSYLQDEIYEQLENQRAVQKEYAYPAEGLDALSDEQIKFLFDGVREYRKALKDPAKTLEEIYSGPEWIVG